MSVSGVRNSWLTLEKNAVFARSISASASARCRSSSYARALAMAVPICVAASSRKFTYRSSSLRRGLIPATRKPAGSSGLREGMGTTSAVCGGSDPGTCGTRPKRSPMRSTVTVVWLRLASPSGQPVPVSSPSSTVRGLASSPARQPAAPHRRARSPPASSR